MRYLLLFGTIITLAGGQLLFKISSRNAEAASWAFLFSPSFITALFLYGSASVAWIFVLRQWPVTVAYPATALAIVIVLLVGWIYFGESLSGRQALGIATILTGLVLLACR